MSKSVVSKIAIATILASSNISYTPQDIEGVDKELSTFSRLSQGWNWSINTANACGVTADSDCATFPPGDETDNDYAECRSHVRDGRADCMAAATTDSERENCSAYWGRLGRKC